VSREVKVSILSGNAKVERTASVAWPESMEEIAARHRWSPGLYSDGHRHGESFVGAEVVGLDVDEGLSLDRAREIVQAEQLDCVVLGSRNHQKEKKVGDEVLPACDRFRIVVLPDRPITSLAEYKATWKKLAAMFEGKLDQSTNDGTRQFFPSPTPLFRNAGKPFPVVASGVITPKEETVSVPDASQPGAAAAFWKADHVVATKGSRHPALLRACKVAMLAGIGESDVTAFIQQWSDACCRPPFDFDSDAEREEVDDAVRWAYAQAKPGEFGSLALGETWKTPTEILPSSAEVPLAKILGVELPEKFSRFNLVQADVLAAEADNPVRMLADLCPARELGAVLAEPEAGKTLFLFYLALEVARTGKRVLYITKDESRDGVKSRFRRYGLEDHPNIVCSLHTDFLFERREWVDEVIELVRTLTIDLVIFDTLRDFMEGDEKENSDMKRVAAALKRVREEGDCAVVLSHHTVKTDWKDRGGRPSLASGSGASDLVSAAAYAVVLVKGTHNPYTSTIVPVKTRGLFSRAPREFFEEPENKLVLRLAAREPEAQLSWEAKKILHLLEKNPGRNFSVRGLLSPTKLGDRTVKAALEDLQLLGFVTYEPGRSPRAGWRVTTEEERSASTHFREQLEEAEAEESIRSTVASKPRGPNPLINGGTP
jgi:hypothetical protein